MFERILRPLQRNHVGKGRTGGYLQRGEGLAGVLVGDVLEEQEDEDVVLVLGSVHAPAEFVAGGPEGGVEVGFLDGHRLLFQ